MAEYLQKPRKHTVERDNYNAEMRRRRALRCGCGNPRRHDETECVGCRRPMIPGRLSPAQSEAAERDFAKSIDRKLRR